MKIKITALLFICQLGLLAQVSYPYYNSFDDATAQAEWQEYRKGATANAGWEYTTFGSYSAPECLIHFYPVGGSQPSVDWFVSPQFDFSIGGSIDSLRYAASGFGFVSPDDTVAICLLLGSRDPDSATVTILYDFRDTAYMNDNVWRKLENIQIAPTTQEAYIAFKYVTTVNWLDVRFDNVAVSGNGLSQPEQNGIAETLIFPNPANSYIEIAQHSEITQITLYGLDGEKLAEKPIEGNRRVDVSAWKGVVFYELTNQKGAVVQGGKLMLL
jgi:hypothetical protein